MTRSNIVSSESITESSIDDSDSFSIVRNNDSIGSKESKNASGNFDKSFVLSLLHGIHAHRKIHSKKDRSALSSDS